MSELMKEITTQTDDTISRWSSSKSLFNIPNTIDLWNGKDNIEKSKPYVGGCGRDVFTSHLIQDDIIRTDIKYSWNSLGLRGPEPDYNANTKIIFGGGSLCLGTGINVEESFPFIVASKLDASYINLSAADSLTDLVDPLIAYKNFNPDYVILNDTRFIQGYGHALRQIYKLKNPEKEEGYKKYFTESDINCLKMFDYFLEGLFPKAKLILAYCERRAWRSMVPTFNNMISIPFESTKVAVDLSRDRFHPGVLSHKIMADFILKGIKK